MVEESVMFCCFRSVQLDGVEWLRNGQQVEQLRRVRFDDTPLADAVAEMNRYNHTAIEIDPAIADTRISGSFRTGESWSDEWAR